jgi:superfamily II DNA/RNA helicase
MPDLAPGFIRKLAERNIYHPTAVQKLVIPPLLAGKNVTFCSATGTGKTFAYLLPLVQRLLMSRKPGETGPRLLIVAPTLELCSQIKQEADFLLRGLDLGGEGVKAGLLIGSANLSRQIESLKRERPAIIVGNPARLLELESLGKLKLGKVAALVLDEGDRLVSDELREETFALVRRVNPARQSAACSATMSARNRERLLPLVGDFFLETGEQEILRERITHWAFFSEGQRKIAALCSFLAEARPKKALVFTAWAGLVGKAVFQLQHRGISAGGFYSGMDKKGRKQALDDFRSGALCVLVSTDLAARGLDIFGVTHVICLDVPADGEAYIHRAGRTARAGRHGVMVTFGDGEELRRLEALRKRLRFTLRL